MSTSDVLRLVDNISSTEWEGPLAYDQVMSPIFDHLARCIHDIDRISDLVNGVKYQRCHPVHRWKANEFTNSSPLRFWSFVASRSRYYKDIRELHYVSNGVPINHMQFPLMVLSQQKQFCGFDLAGCCDAEFAFEGNIAQPERLHPNHHDADDPGMTHDEMSRYVDTLSFIFLDLKTFLAANNVHNFAAKKIWQHLSCLSHALGIELDTVLSCLPAREVLERQLYRCNLDIENRTIEITERITSIYGKVVCHNFLKLRVEEQTSISRTLRRKWELKCRMQRSAEDKLTKTELERRLLMNVTALSSVLSVSISHCSFPLIRGMYFPIQYTPLGPLYSTGQTVIYKGRLSLPIMFRITCNKKEQREIDAHQCQQRSDFPTCHTRIAANVSFPFDPEVDTPSGEDHANTGPVDTNASVLHQYRSAYARSCQSHLIGAKHKRKRESPSRGKKKNHGTNAQQTRTLDRGHRCQQWLCRSHLARLPHGPYIGSSQ